MGGFFFEFEAIRTASRPRCSAQVLRLKGSDNLDYIQLLKKPGGQLGDSYLAEGFVLDKKIGIGQPKRLKKAKVMVANTAMDTDKIKIYGARVKVDSLSKVAAIEQAEKDKMAAKCAKICDHGINCFINRQLIYNFPEQLFTDAGVMAIEHADFDGIERLALVMPSMIGSAWPGSPPRANTALLAFSKRYRGTCSPTKKFVSPTSMIRTQRNI